MKEKEQFTFEEIFKQNEKRVHYHLHKLGIRDPEGEFYAEGMYAMWRAYEKYNPEKGPMATYFNFSIRNRLIDLIRKKVREEEIEQSLVEEYTSMHGNSHGIATSPLTTTSDIYNLDDKLWQKVFSTLTEKQQKWVYYAIVKDYSLKEIAEKEGVSVEAVKSWGKEARRKLRGLWRDRREFEEEV